MVNRISEQDHARKTSIEILAKLKRKLIDQYDGDLAKESSDLYDHIERTLITALRDHYEEQARTQVQENT